MKGLLRFKRRPTTPEQKVEFARDLMESFDVLWCPECGHEIDGSLSTHVNWSNDHPDLESFKEKYEGIPLATSTFGESVSEALRDDVGVFDWERLDTTRDNIVEKQDWIVEVETSGLIVDQSVFDDLVEYHNMREWASLKVGVATSLLIALNDYSYIGAKEVGDELGVDPIIIRRRKKDHPTNIPDIRTPQELLRTKLREVELSEDEFAAVYDELLSYPEEFRGGGRKPATIAALATYQATDRLLQREAAKMFGVTDMAIRNARKDLERRKED